MPRLYLVDWATVTQYRDVERLADEVEGGAHWARPFPGELETSDEAAASACWAYSMLSDHLAPAARAGLNEVCTWLWCGPPIYDLPGEQHERIWCCASPEHAQQVTARFAAVDFTQLRQLHVRHVEADPDWYLPTADSFLAYAQAWAAAFRDASASRRGVLALSALDE